MALVAVTVGLRLADRVARPATALVVLLLAPEAYWPLRRVGAEFHAAAEGTATFAAVDALIGHAPPTHDADAATPKAPALDPGAGLRLDAVSATYPDRAAPVLHRLSATVPGRGVTVVRGPSGAGKSTLLAVLAGDLPPAAGRVLVGGVPVTPELLPVWQRSSAWVPQRPWIAAATIAENVRLAAPSATDAQVWQALERVALGELVAALPARPGDRDRRGRRRALRRTAGPAGPGARGGRRSGRWCCSTSPARTSTPRPSR